MRHLYSILIYLISPFIPLYLLKRSRKNSDYKLFWNERFGVNINNNETKPIIWIHTVSVGETSAIAKIVQILNLKYPNYKLLITSMTPTGRATATNLYKDVIIHYIPYDLPHAVKNFYKTFKPKLGMIMETEIWPNLIFYANKFKIPLFLINARLSDKSFSGYNKAKFFLAPILNCFNGILCQDEITKNNFIRLGYKKEINVIGSTKFDFIYDKSKLNKFDFLKEQIKDKKVVVFSSTREGEEDIIIDNLPNNIDYLIIIIPRHLERFSYVENILIKNNIKYQKRSDNKQLDNETLVLLGDSMGEMMQYYNICDLAIIGGSFSNNGGQNLLEPLFLNKPVIFGPSMFNFETIANNALKENCAIQVKDISECFREIDTILSDKIKYSELVENSKRFINEYTGASEKTINILSKYLG
ncbi:MAG: 3-deoxy-D-manno-octulosonic acid transferase [Neisseriaceae bacterium]